MTGFNSSIAPDRRLFVGARPVRKLAASWPGIRAEVNTVGIAGPARSELCVPAHALLCTLEGGSQSVTVEADGSSEWRGPKLPGATGFFPAGRRVVSKWPAPTELTYLVMFIDTEATRELLDRSTGAADWRTRPETGDPFLAAALARLANVLNRDQATPLGDLLTETLATAVHLHVAERFSNLRRPEGVAVEDGIERVLDLIHDELPRTVPLAQMVAVSGLPRGRFLIAFRRRTGTTPHQFILHERLTRARALLENTDRSVGEVAQAVGCANAGHLTQLFQQHFRTTPRGWRDLRGKS